MGLNYNQYWAECAVNYPNKNKHFRKKDVQILEHVGALLERFRAEY
jgi:hypothetical protein